MSENKDKILEHNYDGIQEFDNPLPRWWLGLFVLTVIWGVIYFFYYHVTYTDSGQEQEYAEEFKTSAEDYEKLAGQMNKMWASVSYVELNDSKSLENGKELFTKNCVSCHGNSGEGGIGPNLTDKYFIHGGGIKNVMTTIIDGVQDKGMISWKPLLKPEEIQKIASYVLSLSGTNPPNAKAPQGEVWEE